MAFGPLGVLRRRPSAADLVPVSPQRRPPFSPPNERALYLFGARNSHVSLRRFRRGNIPSTARRTPSQIIKGVYDLPPDIANVRGGEGVGGREKTPRNLYTRRDLHVRRRRS